MKKLNIKKKQLEEWMTSQYYEFAAETVSDKRLRFLINLYGNFMITHGKDLLYFGYVKEKALESFNKCIKLEVDC